LSTKSKVSLDIYNTKGQKIRTLLDENLSKGSHYSIWDGKDNNGLNVASGVYIYRLKSGNTTQSKKMILMK
jgi:flagellar hook assembly protein FlgD